MSRKFHLALAALGASFAVSFMAAPPAFAITGREAVAQCSVQADCRWGVGATGDIVIIKGGEVAWCDGPDGDCIMMARPNSNRIGRLRAENLLAAPATASTAPPPSAQPAPATTPTVRDHRTDSTTRDHRGD